MAFSQIRHGISPRDSKGQGSSISASIFRCPALQIDGLPILVVHKTGEDELEVCTIEVRGNNLDVCTMYQKIRLQPEWLGIIYLAFHPTLWQHSSSQLDRNECDV